MFRILILLLSINFFPWISATAFADDGVPTESPVREAVARSIPYIEEKGTWWIEEKKCVSCHRVGNMVWSLAAARRSGFDVSDQLDEWIRWSVEESLSKNDQDKVVGLGNKEGVAQLLLGVQGELDSGVQTQLTDLLLDGQQADGSWKAGGQLPSQKRPKSETDSVSTMWLMLALMDHQEVGDAQSSLEKALSYIERASLGKSTESYALRLWLASRNDHADVRQSMTNELRIQQQADGGWGWMVGEESDASGTGLAIFALIRSGVELKDTAIQRAQKFLVTTQREDGSWAVNGTKAKMANRVEETAVFWGTTWATLGLVESLPDRSVLRE